MSGTFKSVPYRRLKRSARTDRSTKTSIKNSITRLLWSDSGEDDDLLNLPAGFGIRGMSLVLISLMVFSSCVSKKVLLSEQDKTNKCNENLRHCEALYNEQINENGNLTNSITQLEMQLASERNRAGLLEQQLEYFQLTNTNLLERLADLSVVSKAGAESIRKSLETLNEQNKYIQDLTANIRQRDSLNLALVMKLKRSLVDVGDEDIHIEVKKGVVYISISDKLLFKSGSAEISPKAEEVLGKIARVLNDYSELEILVEGHTDNVPISNNCMLDNWDLSVKRATTVVRNLQNKHGISPERMTAGGRSEYVPKESNDTPSGKQMNRRTEIIILPELDQFFQLLEPGGIQEP